MMAPAGVGRQAWPLGPLDSGGSKRIFGCNTVFSFVANVFPNVIQRFHLLQTYFRM